MNESAEAIMFKRIDHVEIVTDQLDRTVQFYTDVLGFTVKARDRIERSGARRHARQHQSARKTRPRA